MTRPVNRPPKPKGGWRPGSGGMGRPVQRPASLDWGTMPAIAPGLGPALMAWRLSVGLSRQQLAKAVRLSPDAVKDLELAGLASARTLELFRALRAGGPDAATAKRIQMVLKK